MLRKSPARPFLGGLLLIRKKLAFYLKSGQLRIDYFYAF